VRFYHAPRDRPEAELLLGYASLSLAQIRRGIARLAGVLNGITGQGRGRVTRRSSASASRSGRRTGRRRVPSTG
jgi:hypothetical protein